MIDPQQLKQFALLNSLTDGGLRQAAEQLGVIELHPGDTLFRRGDEDTDIYFLLRGSIALRSDPTSPPLVIDAGSDAAQMPLSRLKPRRYTAIANTPAVVVSMNEDELDSLLTADHTAAYEVSEIAGEDPEWMFRIFSSPAFRQVPADNLAALFSRLQPLDVVAGQTVIRQGEQGDYYYLIRQGRARVMRAFGGGMPAQVAQLAAGDGFGEEALLSDEPRNATVIMADDGLLMRLAMADFNELLGTSLARRIELADVARMLRDGAGIIDVRTAEEYREDGLPGSLNLPLSRLRHEAEGLPRGRKYIAVCGAGRRSRAATFLLNQLGFDAHVLFEGIEAMRRLMGS